MLFVFFFYLANASESDRRNLLSELNLMKKLKSHPHVIKLMGCVTVSGKGHTVIKYDWYHTYTHNSKHGRQSTLVCESKWNLLRRWISWWYFTKTTDNCKNLISYYFHTSFVIHILEVFSSWNLWLPEQHFSVCWFFSFNFCTFHIFIDPLLVLIEYVPYGDLLGHLRKSRGLNDTYFKDPDVKPQTSLTAEQLMRFAWQVADGMLYLSSRKVWLQCLYSLTEAFLICLSRSPLPRGSVWKMEAPGNGLLASINEWHCMCWVLFEHFDFKSVNLV